MSRLHKGFSPTVFSTSCVVIQDSHLQADDLQDQYPAAVPHRQDQYLPQQVYHHRCTATATATATATTFACLAAGDMAPSLPSLSFHPPPSAPVHQANSSVSVPPSILSMSQQTGLPQSASEGRSAVPALDPQAFELGDVAEGRYGENHSDYHYFPPGLFLGAVSSLDCDQEPNYALKTGRLHNNPSIEETGYRSSYSLVCEAENVQSKLGSFTDYSPTQSHESYDTFDVSTGGETYLDSYGLFLESGVQSHCGFSQCGPLESISEERGMDRQAPQNARQNSCTVPSSCMAIECLRQDEYQQDDSHIYQHFSASSPFKHGDNQASTFAAGAAFFSGTEHEEPLRNSAMFQDHETSSTSASNYHLTTEPFLLNTEKEQHQQVHFFDGNHSSETEQNQQHRDFCKKDFKVSSSDTEERNRTISLGGDTVASRVNKTEMDPARTLKADKRFDVLSQKARRLQLSDCFHASPSSVQLQFHDQTRARLPEAVSPFHQFAHLSSSQLDPYSFQTIPTLHSVPAQASAPSPAAPSCDDSNGSCQSEAQSPSPGSAVNLVDVDHLLASGVTVGGFKPRPIIRKRRKITVPCEQKDDGYWQKRRKNNDSAKRSREAKKEKEKNFYRRALELECENYFLKERLGQVEAQLHAFTGAAPTPYSVFPSDASSSV